MLTLISTQCDIFNVFTDIISFISQQGSHLTLDDYSEVSAALWDARHKWFAIGARFGIKVTDLEAIRNEDDVEERFQRMVIMWLKAGKNCNWKHVCEALGHPTVGMQHMAMKLKSPQEDRSETTDGWLLHFILIVNHTQHVICTSLNCTFTPQTFKSHTSMTLTFSHKPQVN